VSVAAAGVGLATGGTRAAYSAAVGGAICVLSGAYLAARMFRTQPGSSPAQVLRAFYVGEVVKVALTALLFAVTILYLDVDVLIVILAYVAALAVYWVALVTTAGRQR